MISSLPAFHVFTGRAPGVGGVGHHRFVVALTEIAGRSWVARRRRVSGASASGAHRAAQREGQREGWSASGEPHGVCTHDAVPGTSSGRNAVGAPS
jgi:hypothetical protein